MLVVNVLKNINVSHCVVLVQFRCLDQLVYHRVHRHAVENGFVFYYMWYKNAKKLRFSYSCNSLHSIKVTRVYDNILIPLFTIRYCSRFAIILRHAPDQKNKCISSHMQFRILWYKKVTTNALVSFLRKLVRINTRVTNRTYGSTCHLRP